MDDDLEHPDAGENAPEETVPGEGRPLAGFGPVAEGVDSAWLEDYARPLEPDEDPTTAPIDLGSHLRGRAEARAGKTVPRPDKETVAAARSRGDRKRGWTEDDEIREEHRAKYRDARRETPRMRMALRVYCLLGPDRKLRGVIDQWARYYPDLKCPSHNVLVHWSRWHGWKERAEVHDQEELDRQIRAEDRARERLIKQNADRYQQIGAAGFALVSAAIRRYVDARTGELRAHVPARDLPALMKAAMDLTQMATGGATEHVKISSAKEWEEALKGADADTRLRLIEGLRAAREIKRTTRAQ